MHKKLLLGVLTISCAVTNLSYGGFLGTIWERVLKPYPNLQETELTSLSNNRKLLITRYRRLKGTSFLPKDIFGVVSKEEYRTIMTRLYGGYYNTFTVYHPTTANILYYSLLTGICYGTYKLTRKETRDKIKKNARKVVDKIKDRFKKQVELATIDVSAKSPKIKI